MTTLLVLQHIEMEGPARIGDLAAELGLRVEIRQLHRGDPVPATLPGDTILCVMGGPMGVGDLGDPRYPFLAHEIALLREVLAKRQPMLGVCLGAQLLAHAAGASVHPLLVGEPAVRHREVGWGAISRVVTADQEPVLAGLDESEIVLHWHGDTFDLPTGATLLASTLACPHQFYHLHRRAWGLQFHVEVTAPIIADWVTADAAFVRAANGPAGGARILTDTARYIDRHRQVGDRLIRQLLLALR